MVVDTCNRFEVYAYAEPSRLRASITSMINPRLVGYDEGRDYSCYLLRGEEAVLHLVRVVCGLDSMIQGDQQIRNQIRKAVGLAESVGALGDPLKGVIQRAIRAAREITSLIMEVTGERSVSEAAVSMVRQSLGCIEHRDVLVIGTGEAGKVALRALRQERVRSLWVLGGDARRVFLLGRHHGAEPLLYEDLERALLHVDAVINSSTRPGNILDREGLNAIMSRRAGRPLVIVDISMPRGFPEWCSRVEGVVLKDLRDLGEWSGEAAALPLELENLVRREALRIASWLEERRNVPLVSRMRKETEELGREAVEEIAARLRLDGSKKEYLGRRIEKLVRRILHHQTLLVKALPDTRALSDNPRDQEGVCTWQGS
jgi:glutamyl-tRNA reductase